MKCIIYQTANNSQWIYDSFSSLHPLLLTVANKPVLEFYFDMCSLMSITDVAIVSDSMDSTVQSFYEDGSRWGLTLSYVSIQSHDTIFDCIHKTRAFIGDDSLLAIHFSSMLLYRNTDFNRDLFVTNDPLIIVNSNRTAFEIYPLEAVSAILSASIELTTQSQENDKIIHIDSVKKLFDTSFQILDRIDCSMEMGGYNNEDGIYIGQNVIIPRFVTLNPPLSIGDNCNLLPGSVIGPHACVGDNVVIDSATTIMHSIVLANTYVGTHLEIDNKIVHKHFLIDPETELSVSIEDEVLIRESSSFSLSTLIRLFTQLIIALLLTILYFIPGVCWLLAVGYLKAPVPPHHKIYLDKKCRTGYVSFWDHAPESFFSRLCWRFSIDKFPLIVRSLYGELNLVGNTILDVNDENQQLIGTLPDYKPSVFSYSNMLSNHPLEQYEQEIHERYFTHSRSVRQDCSVLIKAFVHRLFYPI